LLIADAFPDVEISSVRRHKLDRHKLERNGRLCSHHHRRAANKFSAEYDVINAFAKNRRKANVIYQKQLCVH
jgi:hypothetical protein